MTKKTQPAELVEFARSAALLAADQNQVGEHLQTIDEGDSAYSLIFDAKMVGYAGWRWSVTVYAPAKQEPTVSEVVLIPGDDALLAPAWVPWAERLADWKALQAELEAQAAAEAAELESDEDADEDDEPADSAGEDEDGEESADADFEDVDEEDSMTLEEQEKLALANPEEGVDSEQDADDAGPRPPRFGRRNRGRKNNKNRKN